MNTSLRSRLFLWLSVLIVVMSAATAALSFAFAFEDANDLQDSQLRQVAVALAAQPIHSGTPFTPRDAEDAETHFVIRKLGARIVSLDPQIDVFMPETLLAGLQSIESRGVHWRVMVALDVDGQRFGVAQRQTVRDEVAMDSAMLTLFPMLVLVPLLLLLINLLLRQGFAPLVALSREVDRADDAHLNPLDPSDVPSEAVPLVHAVNRLLERLRLVLEQQRRMVADAAHELRTPVAATKVQADNLAHAALPADARTRLDALQRGLGRISDLIEQLLRLARVQGAAARLETPTALDAVIRSAVEEILPLAEQHGVDLGCLVIEPVTIRGDSLHAHSLVRNAIDNAVRYTPAGGAVDVSLRCRDGQAELIVEDTGPGIPPTQRARVFEPFYRILGSGQSGSGLGLAIVGGAAQALGGRVELTERADGRPGLRFIYRQKSV